MKNLREYLEEQINEDLIQAVLSGSRSDSGPSKVKIRPVKLKNQICYQASATEGTKIFHKNFTQGQLIEYLEKDLRMIHFHMRHGIIYHAFGKFDDYAPEIADYHFVRCHRSYVVNLDYLKCIRGSDLPLLDGTAIPIGRSYKPQVLDMLTNSK